MSRAPVVARDGAAERAFRLKVFVPIQLLSGTDALRAHMLNVSATGALIHAESLFSTGDIVTIRLRDADIAARIVRVVGLRLGMMFVRPMSATMLAALLG